MIKQQFLLSISDLQIFHSPTVYNSIQAKVHLQLMEFPLFSKIIKEEKTRIKNKSLVKYQNFEEMNFQDQKIQLQIKLSYRTGKIQIKRYPLYFYQFKETSKKNQKNRILKSLQKFYALQACFKLTLNPQASKKITIMSKNSQNQRELNSYKSQTYLKYNQKTLEQGLKSQVSQSSNRLPKTQKNTIKTIKSAQKYKNGIVNSQEEVNQKTIAYSYHGSYPQISQNFHLNNVMESTGKLKPIKNTIKSPQHNSKYLNQNQNNSNFVSKNYASPQKNYANSPDYYAKSPKYQRNLKESQKISSQNVSKIGQNPSVISNKFSRGFSDSRNQTQDKNKLIDIMTQQIKLLRQRLLKIQTEKNKLFQQKQNNLLDYETQDKQQKIRHKKQLQQQKKYYEQLLVNKQNTITDLNNKLSQNHTEINQLDFDQTLNQTNQEHRNYDIHRNTTKSKVYDQQIIYTSNSNEMADSHKFIEKQLQKGHELQKMLSQMTQNIKIMDKCIQSLSLQNRKLQRQNNHLINILKQNKLPLPSHIQIRNDQPHAAHSLNLQGRNDQIDNFQQSNQKLPANYKRKHIFQNYTLGKANQYFISKCHEIQDQNIELLNQVQRLRGQNQEKAIKILDLISELQRFISTEQANQPSLQQLNSASPIHDNSDQMNAIDVAKVKNTQISQRHLQAFGRNTIQNINIDGNTDKKIEAKTNIQKKNQSSNNPIKALLPGTNLSQEQIYIIGRKLQENNRVLQSYIASLQQENIQLKSFTDDLKQKNNKKQSKIKQLQAKNLQLKTTVSQLQTSISASNQQSKSPQHILVQNNIQTEAEQHKNNSNANQSPKKKITFTKIVTSNPPKSSMSVYSYQNNEDQQYQQLLKQKQLQKKAQTLKFMADNPENLNLSDLNLQRRQNTLENGNKYTLDAQKYYSEHRTARVKSEQKPLKRNVQYERKTYVNN